MACGAAGGAAVAVRPSLQLPPSIATLPPTLRTPPVPHAAADPTVGRAQAMALLKSWFRTSPLPPSRHGLATAAAGAAAGKAPADPWESDAAFMAWADGTGGAARIGMELKASLPAFLPSLLASWHVGQGEPCLLSFLLLSGGWLSFLGPVFRSPL